MKQLIITIFSLVIFISASAQTVNRWYDPQKADTDFVAGRGWGEELRGTYYRLPERIKDSLRESLWNLSRNSAGLSVSFMTNSPAINVKYTVSGGREMYHMPATGVSGVDLYAFDDNGERIWCKANWPNLGDTLVYPFGGLEYSKEAKRGYRYELYLPLYATVTSLQIGVVDGSFFEFVAPSSEKPMVAYGTSITQGACASRPAMAWSTILSRQMNLPMINLGFSGQGQLDMAMFRMLGEIDARVYIIDCLPNLIREKLNVVYPNTIEGVKYLRSKSSAPILLAEHSGYMNDLSSPEAFRAYDEANKELRRAYQALLKAGVKELYYITKQEIGLSRDSQVDGVHPSDLGMQQYADGYTKALKGILKKR